MELNFIVLHTIVSIVSLCTSVQSSSTKSAKTRCHSDVETITSGRRARYVTKVPTMKDGYGLLEDRFMLAVKITDEFHYLKIDLNFGTSEYESPHITAEQLGLTRDGKWHQLWIDLEPTDLAGVDNWHLYIKSDLKDEVFDIDTGYVWHWSGYQPRQFRVYAKGKSYWIPRGDAAVCNALDAERHSYGSLGHWSIGNSAHSTSALVERNLLQVLFLPLVLLLRMAGAQAID